MCPKLKLFTWQNHFVENRILVHPNLIGSPRQLSHIKRTVAEKYRRQKGGKEMFEHKHHVMSVTLQVIITSYF